MRVSVLGAEEVGEDGKGCNNVQASFSAATSPRGGPRLGRSTGTGTGQAGDRSRSTTREQSWLLSRGNGLASTEGGLEAHTTSENSGRRGACRVV